MLTTIKRHLSRYLDIAFLLKFIVLMAGLYYFNLFYVGITDPRGKIYSPFLTHYLDYISWLRVSILHTANLIVHGFGFPSYVADDYTLRMAKGVGVIMAWPCVGTGIMSFWLAFILAQDSNWQKKLLWSVTGMAVIWLMNCWRIGLLLMALDQKWEIKNYNQHDLFNNCCYLLIMVMMYVYYRKSKKKITVKRKTPVTKIAEVCVV